MDFSFLRAIVICVLIFLKVLPGYGMQYQFSRIRAAAFKWLPSIAKKGGGWSAVAPSLTALGAYGYYKQQLHQWNNTIASDLDPHIKEHCSALVSPNIKIKKMPSWTEKNTLGICYPPVLYIKEANYSNIQNRVALLTEAHHIKTNREAKVIGSLPAGCLALRWAKERVKALARLVKVYPFPSTLPRLVGQCVLTKLAGNLRGITTLLGAIWYKRRLDYNAYDQVLSALSLDELREFRDYLQTQPERQQMRMLRSVFDLSLAQIGAQVKQAIKKQEQQQQ